MSHLHVLWQPYLVLKVHHHLNLRQNHCVTLQDILYPNLDIALMRTHSPWPAARQLQMVTHLVQQCMLDDDDDDDDERFKVCSGPGKDPSD